MVKDDPLRRNSMKVTGPTRRAFVAGASAAGAALLSGSTPQIAEAHENKKLKRGPKRPTCVALNGAHAVTSNDDGFLKVVPIPPNKGEVKKADKKHDFKASYVSIAAGRAATAGFDGLVIVHDLNTLAPIVTLDTHSLGRGKPEVWVAQLSADGMKVLIGTNDGQIMLWDTQNPDLKQIKRFRYSRDPVAGLAFIPHADDPAFLSTHDGVINLWKVSDLFEPFNTYSHKNDDPVNAVAVSTDGKMFVSGSFDSTVRVWNVELQQPLDDPKPLHVFTGHKDVVWRVAISEDKSKVASAGEDGSVRGWSLVNKLPSNALDPGKYGSMGVAFKDNTTVVFTTDGSDPNQLVDAKALVFPVAAPNAGQKAGQVGAVGK